MNSVHPSEARLDRQGIFCRLVITNHTFQGCGISGADIWMDCLRYLSNGKECAVQSAVPGMTRHFLSCHVVQSCLATLCYHND